MDSVLRQSKAVCPFLKKSSPATLRTLSTARPQVSTPSHCGGSMSNLQLLANRCPIMSKAIALRSAHHGRSPMARSAASGVRAFNSHSKTPQAKIHTTRADGARPHEETVFGRAPKGKSRLSAALVSP
ncbi:MAG: hypothetical protein IMZ46_20225 [Acidobacteria bacterium]|nr:hypothetical protein [Acidobacteriota bacterium]